jgi:predicted transcriptional regulator
MTTELNLRPSISKVSMLQVLLKQGYYDLIFMIGDEVNILDKNLTPDLIRNKLNLTKREWNFRIEMLMSYDLVIMIDNQYDLTTLGKEVYMSLRIIEDAIKMHRMLEITNIL